MIFPARHSSVHCTCMLLAAHFSRLRGSTANTRSAVVPIPFSEPSMWRSQILRFPTIPSVKFTRFTSGPDSRHLSFPAEVQPGLPSACLTVRLQVPPDKKKYGSAARLVHGDLACRTQWEQLGGGVSACSIWQPMVGARNSDSSTSLPHMPLARPAHAAISTSAAAPTHRPCQRPGGARSSSRRSRRCRRSRRRTRRGRSGSPRG